mmetsp:Transcript_80190/g.144807  ORF Transcript_80190/g.144807 Transcript_80190/m.144807 type:complete len:240 (+) Transcript_80190:1059-1778(+)
MFLIACRPTSDLSRPSRRYHPSRGTLLDQLWLQLVSHVAALHVLLGKDALQHPGNLLAVCCGRRRDHLDRPVSVPRADDVEHVVQHLLRCTELLFSPTFHLPGAECINLVHDDRTHVAAHEVGQGFRELPCLPLKGTELGDDNGWRCNHDGSVLADALPQSASGQKDLTSQLLRHLWVEPANPLEAAQHLDEPPQLSCDLQSQFGRRDQDQHLRANVHRRLQPCQHWQQIGQCLATTCG